MKHAIFLSSLVLFLSLASSADEGEVGVYLDFSGGAVASGSSKSPATSIGFAPAAGVGAALSYGLTDRFQVAVSVNQEAAFGLVVPDAVVPIPGSAGGQTLNGALQSDVFTSSVRLRIDFSLDLVVGFGDLVGSDVFIGAFAGPAFGVFNHQYLLNPADLTGALLLPGQISPDIALGGVGGVAVGARFRMFDFLLADTELRASAGYVGSPAAHIALAIRPAVAFYPLTLF